VDFLKLKMNDITSFDSKKLRDTEVSLRKELGTIQMDVYNVGPQVRTKSRNLRKVLAQILTAKVSLTQSSKNKIRGLSAKKTTSTTTKKK
jgi:hypothetical protein